MNLRAFGVASAALIGLAASASAAPTSFWYIGLGAGYSMPSDVGVEGVNLPLDNTWRGIATIGYSFDNHIRAETEFGYTGPSLKNAPTGVKLNTNQFTLLANALYDMPLARDLAASVGAGLGYTYVNVSAGAFGDSESTNGSGFAWQLIAGLTYSLMGHTDVQFDYRYVRLESVGFQGTSVTAPSHNLMATIRIHT